MKKEEEEGVLYEFTGKVGWTEAKVKLVESRIRMMPRKNRFALWTRVAPLIFSQAPVSCYVVSFHEGVDTREKTRNKRDRNCKVANDFFLLFEEIFYFLQTRKTSPYGVVVYRRILIRFEQSFSFHGYEINY